MNNVLKKLTCAASVTAVLTTLTAIQQKPAHAASTAIAPANEVVQELEPTTLTAPTAPAELISRYAVYSFRLNNGRSQSIYYFYASPSNVDSWEEDILGSDILAPDETSLISIDDNRASCFYDFKAVFADGSSSTAYGIDICDLSQYTF